VAGRSTRSLEGIKIGSVAKGKQLVAKFQRFHLTITGVLFLIAIICYAVGAGFGAWIFSILGIVVEISAWISMFSEQSEQSSTPPKD
jgi:hypothetical protein